MNPLRYLRNSCNFTSVSSHLKFWFGVWKLPTPDTLLNLILAASGEQGYTDINLISLAFVTELELVSQNPSMDSGKEARSK
jgi:hypothetical protein